MDNTAKDFTTQVSKKCIKTSLKKHWDAKDKEDDISTLPPEPAAKTKKQNKTQYSRSCMTRDRPTIYSNK